MAHALPPADQAWLLGALPPARRLVLEGLMVELQELGIPADPGLLDMLEPSASPPPAVTGVAALHALPARQVGTLALVLQREGPGVCASLLGMRPWPWQGALLQAVERDFADTVRGAAARAPAPAFEAALCNALLSEVEEATGTASRPPGLPLWQRACGVLRPIRWRA
jgi:hypothetical protein